VVRYEALTLTFADAVRTPPESTKSVPGVPPPVETTVIVGAAAITKLTALDADR
jgi:hypothetical protein